MGTRPGPSTLFWLFVGAHALVWFLVPLLGQPNVHREVIELANWAKYPAWSYWKHPPLQTWVTELFLRLSGRAAWGIYLASQVALTACFWAVWRLGRDVLRPAHALVGVLLLEGVLYYNYNAPKFNHDSLQVPLWALTVLFSWRGLTRGGAADWLLAGAAAALGVLSKYTIGALLASLGLFVLVHPGARRHLRTPGPYLALGVSLLLLAPHVWWLVAHDFSPITFALGRAEREGRWVEHLWHPVRFAGAQALVLAPMGLLLAALRTGARDEGAVVATDGFTRAFLFTVTLGPLLAVAAAAAVTGLRPLSGWGRPFWSFAGVFVLYHWRPTLAAPAVRRFGALVVGLAALWAVLFAGQFALGPVLTGRLNPEHFPGQAIAEHLTREWHRRAARPLPVVAGDKWLIENVAFHSPDRPDLYDLHDSDPRKNLGTSDPDFARRGGLIVWDAGAVGDDIPPDWRARFPAAERQPALTFPWQTRARVPPVRLGWALLPGSAGGDRR
jgi:4-amino-4-deoxy-L-arabinose transferase-like glycosyltransferase